jgi:hypothetical protein
MGRRMRAIVFVVGLLVASWIAPSGASASPASHASVASVAQEDHGSGASPAALVKAPKQGGDFKMPTSPNPFGHIPGLEAPSTSEATGLVLGVGPEMKAAASEQAAAPSSEPDIPAPSLVVSPSPAWSAPPADESSPSRLPSMDPASSGAADAAPATTVYQVSGYVRGPGGVGLPGIQVAMCGVTNVCGPSNDHEDTSGPDGAYSVAVPANITTAIWFHDPSGTYGDGWWSSSGLVATLRISNYIIVYGDRSGMDVALQPVVHLAGKVTDHSSAGRSGIIVRAMVPNQSTGYIEYGRDTSAADGTYSLSVAPGCTYWLFFQDPANQLGPGWFSTAGFTYDPVGTSAVDAGNGRSDLDLSMPEALTVSGNLTNAAGQALPEIQVTASRYSSAAGDVVITVTSGSDGHYLVAVPPGSISLTLHDPTGVYANGGMWATVVEASVSGIDAVMALAVHISGRVTGPDGEPVAGLRVEADPSAKNTTTAADGTYRIEVRPGDYRVYFGWSDSYYSGWYTTGGFSIDGPGSLVTVPTDGDAANIDVVLIRLLYIRGRVTNSNGDPIAGISATAYRGASAYASTTTGADGIYVLGAKPATTYTVRFSDPSEIYATGYYATSGFTYSAGAATPVEVGSADVTGIDVVLPRTLHISGKVTITGGAALSGIHVTVYSGSNEVANQYATGSDGLYSIIVLPGTYTVEFHDLSTPHYIRSGWYSVGGLVADQASATPIVLTDHDATDIDAQMQSMIPIVSGQVTNTDGDPVANICVTARPDGTCQATTQADGSYAFSPGTGGQYIRFIDPGNTYVSGYFSSAGLVLTQGAATIVYVSYYDVPDIDVVLTPCPFIRGKISDDSADPLVGIEVRYQIGATPGSQSFLTAADGTYAVKILTPGSDVVLEFLDGNGVHANGWYSSTGLVYSQAAATPIHVDWADVTGIDATMLTNGSISGSVTASGGGGLGGRVELYAHGALYLSAALGSGGAFSLSVRPDTYVLKVLATGRPAGWHGPSGFAYDSGAAEQLVISSGGAITASTQVPQFLTLSGKVTAPNGAAVSGVEVDVYRGTGFWGYVMTAGDGSYSIQVVPGEYFVGFYSANNAHASGWYSSAGFTADTGAATPVDVYSASVNASITLPTTRHISGKITAPTASAGAVVVEAFAYGSYYSSVWESSTGNYSIPVPPGDCVLWFWDASKGAAGGWYTPAGPTSDWTAATVKTVGTSDLSGVNITLPAGVLITGHIDGWDVYDVGYVWVDAYAYGNVVSFAETNGAGGYSMRLLPATYALYVDNAGMYDSRRLPYGSGWYTTAASGHFTPDPSAATPVTLSTSPVYGLNVTLPKSYAIQGKVTDVNGIGLNHVAVGVFVNGYYYGDVISGADGTYSVRVPAASYKAAFADPYGRYEGGWYGTVGLTDSFDSATNVHPSTGDVSGIDAAMPVRKPDRPIDAQAIAYNKSALVSWAHPASGVAVTGYTVAVVEDTGKTCTTTGETFCTVTGLTNDQPYTFTVTATNDVGTGPASEPSGAVTPHLGSTYYAVTPYRVMDSRYNIGAAKFHSRTKQSVLIADGSSGVPADATAVTGNLTIVNQTRQGYITVAPSLTSGVQPPTSTLNFPLGDVRANGVTVPLAANGYLDFMYWSSSTADTVQVIFDVTGFFRDGASYDFVTGSSYYTVTPYRVMDSRYNIGGSLFHGRTKQTVAIATTESGVPADAVAVTGNLTITGQTRQGYVSVAPSLSSGLEPPTSTLNFPLADTRANNVTVPLAADGYLDFMYWSSSSSNTVQVIFDVTGYFRADSGGATYFTVTPYRVMDSRYNIGAAIYHSRTRQTVRIVTVQTLIPSNATAVTGNLTVTSQIRAGYITVAPSLTSGLQPPTSTLNFPYGDTRANGVDAPLAANGYLDFMYWSSKTSDTVQVIFDVTGFFG